MQSSARQASLAACSHLPRYPFPRRTLLARCVAVALALGVTAAAGASGESAQSSKSDLALRQPASAKLAPLFVNPALTSALIDHVKATLERTLPAVPANSITVSNCDDSGTGSLRDAVTNAQDGDTIDMTALTCSGITLTTGTILTGLDNLTLQGPGALALQISGGDQYIPLTHIGNGTLAINDLTIAHGYKYGENARGGCIFSGGVVSLSNSQVKYCTARSASTTYGVRGGGIYATTGVILESSSVTGNVAYSTTSYAYGGGIYTPGDLVLNQSTISGNEATTTATSAFAQGGGAETGSFLTSGGSLAAKYSTISNNVVTSANSANGLGGGLYTTGNVTITNSTLSGNQATDGGAIELVNRANVSTGWAILNSTISGNQASYGRAGVSAGSNTLEILNSTIALNSSANTGKYGSGLRIAGSVNADLQSTIIAGNTTDIGSGPLANDVNGSSGASLTGANNLIGFSSLTPPADTIVGTNPQLSPLAFHGGATATQAISDTSPAIDAGNNAANVSFDQRGTGFPRVSGANADIGAYEVDLDDVIFANGFE